MSITAFTAASWRSIARPAPEWISVPILSVISYAICNSNFSPFSHRLIFSTWCSLPSSQGIALDVARVRRQEDVAPAVDAPFSSSATALRRQRLYLEHIKSGGADLSLL